MLSSSALSIGGYLYRFGWSGASAAASVTFAVWRPAPGGGSFTLVGSTVANLVQMQSTSQIAPDTVFAVQAGDRVGACYTGVSPFYEQAGSAASVNLTSWAFPVGSVLSAASVSGSLTITSTSKLNIQALIAPAKPVPNLSISSEPSTGIVSGANVSWSLTSSIAAGAGGATVDTTCWWTTSSSVTVQSSTNLAIFSLQTPFVFAEGSTRATATLSVPSSGLGSFQCFLTVRTTGVRDADWDLTNIPSFALLRNTVAPHVTIEYGLTDDSNNPVKLRRGGAASPVQLLLVPAPTAGPVAVQVVCSTFASMVFHWSVGNSTSSVASLPAVPMDATISSYRCDFSVLQTDDARDRAYDTATRVPATVQIRVLMPPSLYFRGISDNNPTIDASQVTADLSFSSDVSVSALGARVTMTCVVAGSATAAFPPIEFVFQGSSRSQTMRLTFPRGAADTAYSCSFATVAAGTRDPVMDVVTFDPSGPITFTTAAGTPTTGGAVVVWDGSSSTGADAGGASGTSSSTASGWPNSSANTVSVPVLTTIMLASAAILFSA